MWRSCFALVAILIASGCSGSPLAKLNSPDQLTLYSIDGRDEDRRLKDLEVKSSETFHGYPVLGKVEVTDPDRRKQLIAALKDAHARRPTDGAKCFWPRHGIRAIEKGQTIEYVVCFECSRFEEFMGGKKLRHDLLNSDVQPTFDKPLTEAGIPIAPE
jgi:hypothetical protein